MSDTVTIVCETQARSSKLKASSTTTTTGRSPAAEPHLSLQNGSESLDTVATPARVDGQTMNFLDQKSTDSGYVSLRATPTKFQEEPCHGHVSVTKTRIKSFDKDISEAHHQRFSDLEELFGSDLRQFVLKKLKGKQDCGTIVWRLRCLGETEESACPWILILCGKDVSEAVRKYLKRPHVKDQYHPSDESLPSFNIQVCSYPLKDLSYPCIAYGHVELSNSSTLCGTLVWNSNKNAIKSATIGGVIKIEQGGVTRYLGMTVGHIADRPWGCYVPNLSSSLRIDPEHLHVKSNDIAKKEGEDDGDDVDHDSSDEDDSDNDEDEDDEFELDLAEVEDISNTVKLWEADNKLLRSAYESPSAIGLVQFHSLSALPRTGRDLDWILFDVVHALPNLMKIDTQPNPIMLSQASGLRCVDARSETLVQILTSHGIKTGILQSSAFILRPGAEKPIHTFVVKLTSGGSEGIISDTVKSTKSVSPLHEGDSGSWVVVQGSNEVIGYVSASDIFQDIYVVPFQSALDDIKLVTGADSCGLWSEKDLQYYNSSVLNTPPGRGADSGYMSISNSPEPVITLKLEPWKFYSTEQRASSPPHSQDKTTLMNARKVKVLYASLWSEALLSINENEQGSVRIITKSAELAFNLQLHKFKALLHYQHVTSDGYEISLRVSCRNWSQELDYVKFEVSDLEVARFIQSKLTRQSLSRRYKLTSAKITESTLISRTLNLILNSTVRRTARRRTRDIHTTNLLGGTAAPDQGWIEIWHEQGQRSQEHDIEETKTQSSLMSALCEERVAIFSANKILLLRFSQCSRLEKYMDPSNREGCHKLRFVSAHPREKDFDASWLEGASDSGPLIPLSRTDLILAEVSGRFRCASIDLEFQESEDASEFFRQYKLEKAQWIRRTFRTNTIAFRP